MWETVRSESGKKKPRPSSVVSFVQPWNQTKCIWLSIPLKTKVFLKGRKSWNCHQRHNFFFFFSPFCISEWGEPILLGSGFNKTLTVSPLFLFQHFLHVFLNPPDGHLYPGAPCLNCHSKVLDVGNSWSPARHFSFLLHHLLVGLGFPSKTFLTSSCLIRVYFLRFN